MLKRYSLFLLLITLMTNVFAGSEDWNGQYKIKFSGGQVEQVTHEPNRVRFMFISGFFSTGPCIKLSKGTRLNNIVIKENVELCSNANVEIFTREVAKLGQITSKKITLGPTYHS